MTIVINGTTGISGVDGSAGTPAVQGTDTNTGVFYPAADTVGVSTGGSERMRVDSSGNVGIGTSSPTYKLQVVVADNAAFQPVVALSNAVNADLLFKIKTGVSQIGPSTSTPLAFSTADTERMRIDSSGNLLVGTTSTSSSSVGFRTVVNAGYVSTTTSGNYNICNTASASGTETLIQFQYSNAAKGGISCNGTTITYNTSSDYRLKENIAPMTGALEKVQALKPCIYNWKADGSEGEGFIAHELQEVVPQCVTGEKDAVDENGKPVYQGIDTSFLVATLTAAIQEQQALITSLTARIEALEAK